jgi:beta-lactamase regulating signal transducer with metallopeptidase domain
MIKASELIVNFIINASWQILPITLVAVVCARVLQNAPARYRHLLWVAALCLSVVLPIWSVFPNRSEAPPQTAERIAQQVVSRNASGSPAEPAPRNLTLTQATSPSVAPKSFLQQRIPAVSSDYRIFLALSFVYFIFLLYRMIRLGRLWQRTAQLRRTSFAREVPATMKQIAARCCEALDCENVTLVCSEATSTPGVVGGRKPVIILPASLFAELPDETVSSILGHEIAHVVRRDFLFNLLYEILLLPISFHPLAHFIKQQIDRTRELACDEMVTAKLLEPIAHARSLVTIAGALMTPAEQLLTLGIFNANILEERIMKLTRKTRRLGSRTGRFMMVTAVSLMCLISLAIASFSIEVRADQRNTSGTKATVGLVAADTQLVFGNETRSAQGRVPSQPRAGAESIKDDSSAQQRAQFACEAGRNHSLESIPQLLAMLGDDSKTELIRCWDSGRWSPALATFKQPSPGEQAAIALASMGSPAFGPLTEVLSDQNSTARRNAAWAIGELTNMRTNERAEAVEPLISLLGDADAWVRMASARALGELRDERAGERLIAALFDNDAGVREISAWSLGEMKDARAVQTLCTVVVSDLQIDVRVAAAEALGEIRNQKAVPSLTQALNDAEPRVRAKARWAIAEIEDSDG